jgi:hypothetical protein
MLDTVLTILKWAGGFVLLMDLLALAGFVESAFPKPIQPWIYIVAPLGGLFR